MLGLPDTQVWRVELSCHCNAILIDGGRGPDLSKPFLCPTCEAMVTPVHALRWDEHIRRRLVAHAASPAADRG